MPFLVHRLLDPTTPVHHPEFESGYILLDWLLCYRLIWTKSTTALTQNFRCQEARSFQRVIFFVDGLDHRLLSFGIWGSHLLQCGAILTLNGPSWFSWRNDERAGGGYAPGPPGCTETPWKRGFLPPIRPASTACVKRVGQSRHCKTGGPQKPSPLVREPSFLPQQEFGMKARRQVTPRGF